MRKLMCLLSIKAHERILVATKINVEPWKWRSISPLSCQCFVYSSNCKNIINNPHCGPHLLLRIENVENSPINIWNRPARVDLQCEEGSFMTTALWSATLPMHESLNAISEAFQPWREKAFWWMMNDGAFLGDNSDINRPFQYKDIGTLIKP